jgi:iron complex transport system substrate-binding protein
MLWRAILLMLAALAAPLATAEEVKPRRIVSMNLCTDQLLMRLVEPERILSLSHLSHEAGATPPELLPILKRAKVNRGLAEQVLVMKPDLVLAGTFSTLHTTALLRRVGVRVETFDLELSFDDMRANIRKLGAAVGETERSERMIAEFDRELAALRREASAEAPIYADIGVNNWMPGEGTLHAEIVNAAGLRALGQALGFSGYRTVPLETLIQTNPALISASTPYANPPSVATRALAHPLLRRMLDASVTFDLPARYTQCANPDSLNAIRRLAEARRSLSQVHPTE